MYYLIMLVHFSVFNLCVVNLCVLLKIYNFQLFYYLLVYIPSVFIVCEARIVFFFPCNMQTFNVMLGEQRHFQFPLLMTK